MADEKILDNGMEEVDVVELFDENGDSMVFELLSSIVEDGTKYMLLTAYLEEAPENPEVPADVFVMREVFNEKQESMLEPVEEKEMVEKIFAKFKSESTDKYDFAN